MSELTGKLHLEGSVKTTKLKLTWLPQARLGHMPVHVWTLSNSNEGWGRTRRVARDHKQLCPPSCRLGGIVTRRSNTSCWIVLY